MKKSSLIKKALVPSIVDIVGEGHGENFEHSFNDEDHSEDVVEQLQ